MATTNPVTAQADKNFSERRKLPRADVAIWVEERTNDALYYQRATNLSLGGIWLAGTLPHPPGTRVALDIELPGDGPLRVSGEVVPRPAGKQGMAVRFVGLSESGRERIAAVLAKA